MPLFNRVFQITIGEDDEGAESGEAITIPSTLDQKINANFLLLKNQASNVKPSNYIELYNLQDASQAFIKKRGKRLRAVAGYDGASSVIYEGVITKVNISKKGTDTITRIDLGAKTFHVTDAIFQKSYIGPISLKTVIKDTINSFVSDGVPLNAQFFDILPNDEINNFHYDGRSKDLLDSLLLPRGFNWFIDGDIIKFTQSGQANLQESFTLTNDSGIINTPVKTDKGIIVSILLDGRLQLSDILTIDTRADKPTSDGRQSHTLREEYQGDYKIFSIKHHGNTLTGKFLTEIEAASL